jgi:hypothetical protein
VFTEKSGRIKLHDPNTPDTTLSKLKMKQVLKRPKIRYLHNVRNGRTAIFKKWWSRKW